MFDELEKQHQFHIDLETDHTTGMVDLCEEFYYFAKRLLQHDELGLSSIRTEELENAEEKLETNEVRFNKGPFRNRLCVFELKLWLLPCTCQLVAADAHNTVNSQLSEAFIQRREGCFDNTIEEASSLLLYVFVGVLSAKHRHELVDVMFKEDDQVLEKVQLGLL